MRSRRFWDGEIKVTDGRVLDVELLRRNPKAKLDGHRFKVSSVYRNAQKKAVDGPVLRVSLDAPSTAKLVVQTPQGNIEVALADLPDGSVKTYLNGQASLERSQGAVRLTGRDTEDDFPALARAPDGTAWLAYVEYLPGRPIILDRIKAGAFRRAGAQRQRRPNPAGSFRWQDLAVRHGRDRSRTGRLAADGRGRWQGRRLPSPGASRSTATGKSSIGVTRRPADGAGRWSDIVRLTKAPGSDFHVVAATDSAGVVWLAWQAWRKDNFDILLAALAEDHPWQEPRAISNSPANDWSPAIAADSKGNVHVAWDTYDKGNYDVRLAPLLAAPPRRTSIDVANSARFEARPHYRLRRKGPGLDRLRGRRRAVGQGLRAARVQEDRSQKNPGFRPVRQPHAPAEVPGRRQADETGRELPAVPWQGRWTGRPGPPGAQPERAAPGRRCGRRPLAAATGTIRLPTGGGEVWDSYALRYDGKKWSRAAPPLRLGQPDGQPPGSAAAWPRACWPFTAATPRDRTANRDQDDLFATMLDRRRCRPSRRSWSPTMPGPRTGGAAGPPERGGRHRPHPRLPHRPRRQEAAPAARRVPPPHRVSPRTSDQDGLLEDAWRYALDAGRPRLDGQRRPRQRLRQRIHVVADPEDHRPVPQPAALRGRPDLRAQRRLPERPSQRDDAPARHPAAAARQPQGHAGEGHARHQDALRLSEALRRHLLLAHQRHQHGHRLARQRPAVEPVVEIYQGHRHNYEHPGAPRSATEDTQIGGYEPAGFVWNAFEKGYRLGFQARATTSART